MALRILNPPAVEAVSLAEAKLHLRVDHDDEDGLIGDRVKLAREVIELMTGLCLAAQTWLWTLDQWPGQTAQLPLWPARSVIIEALDSQGSRTVVSPAVYLVDTLNRPARLLLRQAAAWPNIDLAQIHGVQITLEAGYGAGGEALPLRYKQAILLLVGHWYENREAVSITVGANASLLPMGVRSLLASDLKWVS